MTLVFIRARGQNDLAGPVGKSKPRIAIAGLGIESSTFSPAVTEEEAFHTKYGTAIFSLYPFLSIDSPLRNRGNMDSDPCR